MEFTKGSNGSFKDIYEVMKIIIDLNIFTTKRHDLMVKKVLILPSKVLLGWQSC